MYLLVRGFSPVMYLYQAPDGLNLGEKLDYKLVLRNLAGVGRVACRTDALRVSFTDPTPEASTFFL